jgi:HEPN domain-containing protein
MKTPLDHAMGLLQKATNDLLAAQAIFPTGQAMDIVCFHAQQTVEKSLKALLAVQDIEYPWRHDLGELMHLVASIWPDIIKFEDRISELTPFAVTVRYDIEFEPSANQARQALETASMILERVKALIEIKK